MGLIQKIVIAILTLSFVVFCALFGSLPRLRRTPIGTVNRLIWIQIPSLLVSLDQIVTGGRFGSFLQRSGNYLMNTNHPLVLLFYLGVVFVAQAIFLPPAFPRLTNFQTLVTIPLCIAPYIITLRCAFSTSSHITPASHPRDMQQYPYDHVLFHPGQWCTTCRHLKPARSKHCRMCGVCVAKHDHHCIWVRTCLGRDNYVYFLLMLLSLGTMLCYGAWLAYGLLDQRIQERYLSRNPTAPPDVWWSRGKTWAQARRWWTWAVAAEVSVGCVGLLALFTAPLAWGLLGYHVYLIWAGMTTNESFKWDEWKEDVSDGIVWKREAGEEERERSDISSQVEPEVDWPVDTSQRLVSRANKASMDRELKPGMVLGEPPWVKVEDLSEVVNLYDLGFWKNLQDVFGSN